MKFACFAGDSGPQLGSVDEAQGIIRPVPAAKDMVDLIRRYGEIKTGLSADGAALPLSSVRLLAPIPHPARNIFCVGKNYLDHAREFAGSGYEAGAVKGAEIDEYPAVFTKPASTVVGPGDTVSLHPHITSAVDYEVELTLVIGKGGRDIPATRAYEHIWGYTIVNDVTARDRQRNHKQWFMGKALDTFCPMGPWIVTADALDGTRTRVRCWVNGELRQDGQTTDFIFDIPSLIETCSRGISLYPGDVIATGTPAGVGMGLSPPQYLKPGDTVRIEIDGLGTLENRFA